MAWLIIVALEVTLFFVTGVPEVLRPTAVQPGELPVIVWAATTLTTLLLLPILAASAALDALARRLARPLGRHLAVALATTAALLWANADAWSARVWYFRLTPLVFTAALWLAFAWRRSERHQPVLALTVALALLGGTVANRLVYPDQYTGQHLALVLLSWFCLRLFFDTPARRRAERAANLALAVAAAAFFVAGRGTLTAPQTERLLDLPSARAAWLAALQRLDDADGDGFGSFLRRADCDDANPAVHPLATEVAADGLDNDCMGGDASPRPPRAMALPPRAAAPYDTIVLLTVDALRADRLAPATMPFLAAQRPTCAVYDNAFATYASTIFSVYSLLHSRMPSTAGGLEKCGHLYASREPAGRQTPNLPLALRARGYATTAIATVEFIRDCNDNRGIETLWAPLPLGGAEPASELTLEHAKSAVATWEDDPRPQFLWVHFFDPHEAYTRRDNPGQAVGATDLERAYNSEVYAVDQAIAELWRVMAGRRVLWLITADHGEAVGRGHLGLTRDELQVPLMICGADVSPGARAEYVSGLDVAPTLLHAAGAAELPPSFQGESLLAPGPRRGYAVAEFLGSGDRFQRVLFQPGGEMRVDLGLGLVQRPEGGSAEMYQSFLDAVIAGP